MSFAKRVTGFSFNDQLEALQQLDFERILKSDSPEEYCPTPKRRGCASWSTSPAADAFESDYLIGHPFSNDFDSSDDDGFDGLDGYGGRLYGGNANPSHGTFLISLSNLASLICALILLHSCVRSWANPVHYVLCVVGLFVASVVIVNTLLALLAVCVFKRCGGRRKEQGTNLLKMHHSVSLLSIIILVMYCASLERLWGDPSTEASSKIFFHFNAHVNRNWMAFLCTLTTACLALGIVGNLNWPHWNENHVAVLKWTLFSTSLISLLLGLFMFAVRLCLFAWLHAAFDAIWGVQFSLAGALCLITLGVLGLATGSSPGKIKLFMLLAPITAIFVAVPSLANILTVYPTIIGAVTSPADVNQAAQVSMVVAKSCANTYCSDLIFASGAAGVGSVVFVSLAFVSAMMVRPFVVQALARKTAKH